MSEKSFRANSLVDVLELSLLINKVNVENRWRVAAHANNLGLMNFREGHLRFLLKGIRLIKGEAGIFAFFQNLQKTSPSTVNDFVTDMSNHVLVGRDTEDNDSVGGWSQREIDLFCTKVKFQ